MYLHILLPSEQKPRPPARSLVADTTLFFPSFPLLLFLLPLSLSSAPLNRSIRRIGNAQGKGIYYCGLQFIPCVLKGPSASCARHATSSTSLPKCGSDPLDILLFSPCVQ